MFKKYNDTPAAIAMALVTIGFIFYTAQSLFWPELGLSDWGIDASAVIMVR
jgi:hypothetical protein